MQLLSFKQKNYILTRGNEGEKKKSQAALILFKTLLYLLNKAGSGRRKWKT